MEPYHGIYEDHEENVEEEVPVGNVEVYDLEENGIN